MPYIPLKICIYLYATGAMFLITSFILYLFLNPYRNNQSSLYKFSIISGGIGAVLGFFGLFSMIYHIH